MIQSPTLADIGLHSMEHQDALCCVLFAPPFSKTAKDGIIPRIAYYDGRSGADINFYCAGYGAYWPEHQYIDKEFIGNYLNSHGSIEPWNFSQRLYSNFIKEFELISTWTYSGETELILFNSLTSLEDCLHFNIDKMLADRVIDHPSNLLESLTRYAQSTEVPRSATGFSDRNAARLLGKAAFDFISKGPKAIGAAWSESHHYAIKSFAK